MSKKLSLLVVFLLALIYPGYTIYQLEEVIGVGNEAVVAQNKLISFQISIWVVWVVMLCNAIFYKWTKKGNFFFYFTYAFLIVAFAVFGFYTNSIVNVFDLSSPFEDNYTHGVFTAVQNIVISCALTAALQAAVWWFTRKWHRR